MLEIKDEGGGSKLLSLSGRLDANTGKQLKEKIQGMVDKDDKRLILNLSGVEFIDSSGLGSLVACYRLASKAGGEIRLCCLQETVRSLMELTRLHRLFEIFDDPEAAQENFS